MYFTRTYGPCISGNFSKQSTGMCSMYPPVNLVNWGSATQSARVTSSPHRNLLFAPILDLRENINIILYLFKGIIIISRGFWASGVIQNKQKRTDRREQTPENSQKRTKKSENRQKRTKKVRTDKREQTEENRQKRTCRREQTEESRHQRTAKRARTDKREQTEDNRQKRTCRREIMPFVKDSILLHNSVRVMPHVDGKFFL